MSPNDRIPGDQPCPPGKTHICKCYKSCGGPNGVGIWVSRSQKYRHKDADIKYLARLNAIAPPVASGSGTPVPPSNALETALGSAAFTIEALPFAHADDMAEDDPVTPYVDEPADHIEPDVPNTLPDNNTPFPDVTFDPGENPSNQEPIADENDYEPPDPYNLCDNDPQHHPPDPPEQSGPPPETDYTPPPTVESTVEEIRVADEFIRMLREAKLNGPEATVEPLPTDFITRLRNPPNAPLVVTDSDERLSLEVFLAVSNASEKTYTMVRDSIRRRHPESNMLSYHEVKNLVAQLSGVTAIQRDMCVNSCMGYTGPFRDRQSCTYCHQPRFGADGKPRRTFTWIPIGPQLQALWRNRDSAYNLHYRRMYTKKIMKELRDGDGNRSSPICDFLDGEDYLDAVEDGKIKDEDMVLVLSIDGAQLYRNKASECWIYIWVIYDYSPDMRYKKKHILPGGFIGGPNKPKHVDSFIFSALYHVSALQTEGLKIWDAYLDLSLTVNPFFALACADGPCMASLSGCVGHHGKVHCRYYCPLKGRHKKGAGVYYPARLKPSNYSIKGCDHPDVRLGTLLGEFTVTECVRRYTENMHIVRTAKNKTDFERRRLVTGISKPSIFSGLNPEHSLPVPTCFPGDIMHLPCLNIPDLMLSLWRGTIDCEKKDDRESWYWAVLQNDVWQEHGKQVALCTPYLPGSFDRPPRNPAEKINSGYKAWEFLLYFFGLGPCLFYGILPDNIWMHYCKLVRGFRLMMQESITVEEVEEASKLFTSFSDDFEVIYVQRKASRIHFVRPCIHGISHVPPETIRLGPYIIFSQWVMERTIGNLGEEIKNHSNPYANLEQRGVRRCQVNALKALIPDFDPLENVLPRGALDIGGGFLLLRARDRFPQALREVEHKAWKVYWQLQGVPESELPAKHKVYRWAKLRLPNGQSARSRWKEEDKGIDHVRMSRHVKLRYKGTVRIGEVHFYFEDEVGGKIKHLAAVSLFGEHNPELYEISNKTYRTMEHFRDIDVHVIEVTDILSVVCMAPDPHYKSRIQDGTENNRWFMVEKPGLTISGLQGCDEAAAEVESSREQDSQ